MTSEVEAVENGKELRSLSVADCGLVIDALRLYGRSYGLDRARRLADAIAFSADSECRLCDGPFIYKTAEAKKLHRCWDPVDPRDEPAPEPG